jgi:NAD-dependent DNA ligase
MSKKISIYHQLDVIHKELMKMNDDTINEIVEMMKGINFEAIVEYFNNSDLDKLDDMDLFTCRKLVEILQFIYNNTDIVPPVSDSTYDKLYQVMLDVGLGDIVGSVNSQGKPVREHRYPDLRGTLNKVHFVFNVDKEGDKRRSIEDWITTIENILGRNINNTKEFELRLQAKWDGCSAVFECDENGNVEHVLMRGDTEKNLAVDIVGLFEDFIDFQIFANGKDKFAVQTEVLMNQADYEKIIVEYKDFKSPRSATSSILNEKILQPHLTKYLTVEPLRIQYAGKQPEIIPNEEFDMISNLFDLRDIRECIRQINEHAKVEGRTTDGVVLHLLDKKLQTDLGRDGAINRYEVAYKFPAESKKAILLDIEFSYGLGGNVTPVAKIEPVVMLGKTISSISMGSIDRFRSMDHLTSGSEIIVRYEIIPYMDIDHTCKVNEYGKRFYVPTHCKHCGSMLVEDPLLKCVNEECPSRIIGNVVNYINKMRIENMNIETVATLFDQGIITGIESLYKLEEQKAKIISLPGFGEKSYENMIDGVNKRRIVFDYELLGSLGIQSIGVRMFKKILSVMDLETLLRLAKDQMLVVNLMGLSGFGEKTASRVQHGVLSKLKTIYFLLDEIQLKEKVAPGKLKGKVCFSQVRDPQFESELTNNGYEVVNSITKTTDYLIVPSLDVVSSKITKAKKYGIIVLSLNEAKLKLK